MADNLLENIDPDNNLLNNYFRSLSQSQQSNYYSVDDFNLSFSDIANNLVICNYNIRSFNCNQELFFTFLLSLRVRFNIVALTETRFDGEEGVGIEGFNGYHCGRSGGGGGGVSIYCSDELSVRKVEHLSYCNEVIEVCTVTVLSGGRKIVIGAIYRPPGGSLSEFYESVNSLLHDSEVQSSEVVLLGDFNIDLLHCESLGANAGNFIYDMFSHNFRTIITKPTRFPCGNQPGEPSLLDHVWYNRFADIESGIMLFGLTDHLPTFLILKNFFCKEDGGADINLVRVEFRDMSARHMDYFFESCRVLDWSWLINDVNLDINRFSVVINDLYCRCFPLKIKYVSRKRLEKPWLTNEILNSIKIKSELYKQFKLGLVTELNYKRFKNKLTNVINRAKKKYHFNKFNNSSNDIKSTWKHINNLIRTKKRNCEITRLKTDSGVITDSLTMAEYFNEFFCNVAVGLDEAIPQSLDNPLDNLPASYTNSFFLDPVGCSELITIISSLKNSSYGLHSIPTRVFKAVACFLVEPLSKIINCSFETGLFPDLLKQATVVPIHKCGQEDIVNNYRPISILPMLSKIFEKCVNTRLSSYLSRYNVISGSQYGFQKSKCTTDAVLNFVENAYGALNNKNHVFGVSIDLRKAFDTVNHNILLNKLGRYGVRGTTQAWFRSYLCNRTQTVKVGSAFSRIRPLYYGVPQGSVLGPALFLLYINDLPRIADNVNFTLFADDTTLTFSSPDYRSLISESNECLVGLYDWTVRNRL